MCDWFGLQGTPRHTNSLRQRAGRARRTGLERPGLAESWSSLASTLFVAIACIYIYIYAHCTLSFDSALFLVDPVSSTCQHQHSTHQSTAQRTSLSSSSSSSSKQYISGPAFFRAPLCSAHSACFWFGLPSFWEKPLQKLHVVSLFIVAASLPIAPPFSIFAFLF